MHYYKNSKVNKILRFLNKELNKLPDIKIISGNNDNFIVVRVYNDKIEYCKLFISVFQLTDWINEELETKWVYDLFPSDKSSNIEELLNKMSPLQKKQLTKLRNTFYKKINKII